MGGKKETENDTRVMRLACINLALWIEKTCRTYGFHLISMISFQLFPTTNHDTNETVEEFTECREANDNDVRALLKKFHSFTSSVH